jgi:hypothetical protein
MSSVGLHNQSPQTDAGGAPSSAHGADGNLPQGREYVKVDDLECLQRHEYAHDVACVSRNILEALRQRELRHGFVLVVGRMLPAAIHAAYQWLQVCLGLVSARA